ncbi:MAG: hypothetical protein ACE149_07730 [Armatimonadota bacterium]
MPDQSRWSEMTDADIEDLIRRLPGERPADALRERVLAAAPVQRRRTWVLQPSAALGTLAILIALDLLTISLQDRKLRWAGAEAPATSVQSVAASAADPDWAKAGSPLLSARFSIARAAPETYLQLRARLLETGEGG